MGNFNGTPSVGGDADVQSKHVDFSNLSTTEEGDFILINKDTHDTNSNNSLQVKNIAPLDAHNVDFHDSDPVASCKRVVIYYSPAESPNTNSISLSDIANNINPNTKKPYINVVEICTLHLKEYSDGSYIHLNDYNPANSMFDDIKSSISLLKKQNIKVLFMLGGQENTSGESPQCDSSWVNLFNDFDTFYNVLKNFIIEWDIDGIDLDIENNNTWSQAGTYNIINVNKLINQLISDFGESFLIVLAPIAIAIYMNDWNGGLSGFDYKRLINDTSCGKYISWLNVQFYNGWGTLTSPTQYIEAVNNQGYDPSLLGV